MVIVVFPRSKLRAGSRKEAQEGADEQRPLSTTIPLKKGLKKAQALKTPNLMIVLVRKAHTTSKEQTAASAQRSH
jgi:hypothetical protein